MVNNLERAIESVLQRIRSELKLLHARAEGAELALTMLREELAAGIGESYENNRFESAPATEQTEETWIDAIPY
jgi:hypothetical protein